MFEKVEALLDLRADVADDGGLASRKAEFGEEGFEFPDGKGVDFRDGAAGEADGPGHRVETGALTGRAGEQLVFVQFLPSQFQLLLFFRLVLRLGFRWLGEDGAVALALRAPAVRAVEGKHPRVQFVEGAVGSRAEEVMAVNGGLAAVIDGVERAAAEGERLGDESGQILAVLQPNFRQSTGFGKKFYAAGRHQWGEKMQDDLTWGVKHLVEKGVADPKRVAIYGGSYGGYALIAVNKEAGGHCGPYPASELIPKLLDTCKIPVISAGGVGTGGQMYSRLHRDGACGVSVGSIFIATEESEVSKEYKQACIDYGAKDIVLSTKISGSPCTVINTPYVQKIGTTQNGLERLLSKNKSLKKYVKMLTFMKGMRAIEKAAFSATYATVWCAGPTIEHVHSVEPVGDIVERLIREYYEAVGAGVGRS